MMHSETITGMLIFKTNVYMPADIEGLAGLLNANIRIESWNLDAEDIDHVLRIKSDQLSISEVNELLQSAGYYCEELPD